jgi:endonuclease/exonuclease/phosphatase family metal-dependent hydrolase
VVRLITWNVARRVQALAAQAAAVAEREPDVLALQEVTARTLPLWETACATSGLPHVACSLAAADAARADEPAQHVHVATEDGEVFAIRDRGVTMIAVAERFTLASLLVSDIRMVLREIAAPAA